MKRSRAWSAALGAAVVVLGAVVMTIEAQPRTARQVAPPPGAGAGESGAKRPSASQPSEAKSVSDATASHLVTWGFMRMERTDTVIRLLHDVQTGKIDKSALSGLGSSEMVKAMGKHDWSSAESAAERHQSAVSTAQASSAKTSLSNPSLQPVAPTRAGEQHAVAPKAPGDTAGAGAGKPGVVHYAKPSASDVAQLTANVEPGPSWHEVAGAVDKSRVLDTDPAKVDLGSLYYGQQRSFTVHFVPVADCDVIVSLPADSKLLIANVTTYTGTLEYSGKSVGKFAGQQVVPKADKTVSKAPFKVAARAGQDASVTFFFAPTPMGGGGNSRAAIAANLLGVPEGVYKSSIQITAGALSATVPVTAKVAGIQYGITSNPEQGPIEVISGNDVVYELPLVNTGAASKAVLTGKNLPDGVTMDRLEVSMEKGATLTAQLRFHFVEAATEGYGQTVTIHLDNGNRSEEVDVPTNIYHPWMEMELDGHAWLEGGVQGGCSAHVVLDIKSDGWFRMQGSVVGGTSVPFATERYRVAVLGGKVGDQYKVSHEVSGTMHDGSDLFNESDVSNYLHYNYLAVIKQGFRLQISYSVSVG